MLLRPVDCLGRLSLYQVTHVRHMVRALGFAGVDQQDWHLDQILCPGHLSTTLLDDSSPLQSNGHLHACPSMVLIDFAFASQRLGEDWSRPGYPVHNPNTIQFRLHEGLRVPWDTFESHWLPMLEEEY